jgi:hypothetical protein
MDLKKFDQAYGAMKFGRELTKKKDAFLRKLQGTLDASDAEAATRFPTFIATEAREALTATLRKNDEASDASAEVDHTTGKLMFEVVYRPVQASYTAKIEGDSARGIGGTAGWSKTWARGRAAAADLTLGQNSQSASASFTHEPQALTKALTWQLDYEGTYTRDHDIRIGTQTGPLVTRRDTLIGPRAKLTYLKAQDQRIAADTTKWQRHWYYSTTLLAGYRSLAGAGPPAFLASPPAHFGGAVFTNVHAFEYTDGPVPPPPAVAEAHRRVGFSAGLNLELTEFAPGGSGAYFRGRLDAFAHQAFGTSAHSDYYVEARSSYGAMTGAAPRVDFWRLGGQDVLGGMEDGELAGRFLLAAALEGGWSVTTLISRWNPAASGGAADPGGSSLLDGLYVVGLAEYGRVGDQARAGADFSRHTKATSLGAGVRLFGALPGPASDSSIFIGYAWSPESIHRSGRIFARVLIHFGN